MFMYLLNNMFLYIFVFISTVLLSLSKSNEIPNGNLSDPLFETTIQNKSVFESDFAMLILSAPGKLSSQWIGPCKYIPGNRKQNHQCRRDSGLPEAIKESHHMAIKFCEEQFRYDRWNCSLETKEKKSIFKKVYRETAFLHALTAAALAHTVARACAEGRMMKCQCANERRPDQNTKSAWRWGGCSDNVKHGKRVAKNFLELQKTENESTEQAILKHDGLVGVFTVMSSLDDKCKCHGVSGSCSMRTCWRKLSGFNVTVNSLKQKYYEAKRKSVNSKNKKRNTLIPMQRKYSRTSRNKPELILISPYNEQSLSYQSLYYLEQSPSYCPATKGRQCLHPENCNILCCGRGFTTREVKTKEKCKCRFKNGQCCQVICDYCEKYEDRYYCN